MGWFDIIFQRFMKFFPTFRFYLLYDSKYRCSRKTQRIRGALDDIEYSLNWLDGDDISYENIST